MSTSINQFTSINIADDFRDGILGTTVYFFYIISYRYFLFSVVRSILILFSYKVKDSIVIILYLQCYWLRLSYRHWLRACHRTKANRSSTLQGTTQAGDHRQRQLLIRHYDLNVTVQKYDIENHIKCSYMYLVFILTTRHGIKSVIIRFAPIKKHIYLSEIATFAIRQRCWNLTFSNIKRITVEMYCMTADNIISPMKWELETISHCLEH